MFGVGAREVCGGYPQYSIFLNVLHSAFFPIGLNFCFVGTVVYFIVN